MTRNGYSAVKYLWFFAAATVALFAGTSSVNAACVSPAGQSSHQVFKTDIGLQYCPDGDNWSTVATGGTPGGSTGHVQFNNAGALAGDSGFTYNGAGSINVTGSASNAITGATTANSGRGMFGTASSGYGVYGYSEAALSAGAGVYGQNNGGGPGVHGVSSSGYGVKGESAVSGYAGVWGHNTSNGMGVYGFSTSGVAAYFTSTSGKALITNQGNVGIGYNLTDSISYKLSVNGTAYATGAAGALSDARHKKNVHALENGVLDTVMKLRPVAFEWKQPVDDGMRGKQFGFIAQEVEIVIPELVLTQDNEEKTKGLKPTEFVPLLVKAIQELKADNDNLRAEIEALKAARR